MPVPSDDTRRNPPSTENLQTETHRKYIKFKMKQVKRAKQRGNQAKAQRHATELLQYLGLDGRSEPPIEGQLEPLE